MNALLWLNVLKDKTHLHSGVRFPLWPSAIGTWGALMHVCALHWHRNVTSHDILECRIISEWWEYERGFMYVMGILLQKANKGRIYFLHLPLTHHSRKWENWFLRCEETAGHKFKGHRNFSLRLKVNDTLCSHRLIVILCRSSAQLSPFFEYTIANGELLYPSLKASCVCLGTIALAETYLYFLHAD